MGSNQSINKMISFEDLQAMLSSRSKFLLVNTLSIMEQSCLIQDTLNPSQELLPLLPLSTFRIAKSLLALGHPLFITTNPCKTSETTPLGTEANGSSTRTESVYSAPT